MVVSGLDGAEIERFGFEASWGPCVVLLVGGGGRQKVKRWGYPAMDYVGPC